MEKIWVNQSYFLQRIRVMLIFKNLNLPVVLFYKMKPLHLLLALSVCLSCVQAQTSIQLSSSEIKARIEKLGMTGSVLYIAAHPDDENTRLLSYLATEKNVRTAYLSLTRGDGGQNLIGTEQAEELGLIRTQELLAARKIDGAEQFFTRANDFGFSKTSNETFQIWNKDSILSDVVWVIRKFRPDVIITRFPPDSRAGHGHHTASAILAIEAFAAAADPRAFPQQLAHDVKPWKVTRLLWNTFNFGGNNTIKEGQLKIDVGQYNVLLGKSYGEIASESRSQHKSQGFGVAKQRGESFEYFELLAGEPAENDLLDNISGGWHTASRNGADVSNLIERINREYVIDAPHKSVPPLVKLHEMISSVADQGLKERKLKEVADIILAASGTWFEAYASEPVYSLTDSIPLKVQAISRYSDKISISPIFSADASSQPIELPANQLKTIEGRVKARTISQPYWLAHSHPIGEYVIDDQANIGQPENPSPLSVKFNVRVAGKSISYERPVVYKFTDPVRGEVYRKLEVAPPVIADMQSSRLLYTESQPQSIEVKLKAFAQKARGTLKLNLPEGWSAKPSNHPFEMKEKGEEKIFRFDILPGQSSSSGRAVAEVNTEAGSWTKAMRSIQYDHIPATTWFPDAAVQLIKLDIKKAGNRIGYLPGAGDLIPESLKQLGYDVTLLNEATIAGQDLSKFDAIITGIRLYNISSRMKYVNDILLKYVESGGVLLVQYNVSQPLVTSHIGPYPFSITRDRVTEERATVTILDPEHPVFNYPNKITARDFDGWVQERGLYFADGIDPKYKKLLSMKDSAENENQGSLFIADYGKGRFVYTGLSFFRQLPAGVPGAYRLFVNLISN